MFYGSARSACKLELCLRREGLFWDLRDVGVNKSPHRGPLFFDCFSVVQSIHANEKVKVSRIGKAKTCEIDKVQVPNHDAISGIQNSCQTM